MTSFEHVPINRCTDPTHKRSDINGRCLTCRSLAMKAQRMEHSKGPPRVAEIIEGPPCRICGSTQKYAKNRTCVACQRKHGQRYRGAVIQAYNVPKEFLQWIMSPAPELNSA